MSKRTLEPDVDDAEDEPPAVHPSPPSRPSSLATDEDSDSSSSDEERAYAGKGKAKEKEKEVDALDIDDAARPVDRLSPEQDAALRAIEATLDSAYGYTDFNRLIFDPVHYAMLRGEIDEGCYDYLGDYYMWVTNPYRIKRARPTKTTASSTALDNLNKKIKEGVRKAITEKAAIEAVRAAEEDAERRERTKPHPKPQHIVIDLVDSDDEEDKAAAKTPQHVVIADKEAQRREAKRIRDREYRERKKREREQAGGNVPAGDLRVLVAELRRRIAALSRDARDDLYNRLEEFYDENRPDIPVGRQAFLPDFATLAMLSNPLDDEKNSALLTAADLARIGALVTAVEHDAATAAAADLSDNEITVEQQPAFFNRPEEEEEEEEEPRAEPFDEEEFWTDPAPLPQFAPAPAPPQPQPAPPDDSDDEEGNETPLDKASIYDTVGICHDWFEGKEAQEMLALLRADRQEQLRRLFSTLSFDNQITFLLLARVPDRDGLRRDLLRSALEKKPVPSSVESLLNPFREAVKTAKRAVEKARERHDPPDVIQKKRETLDKKLVALANEVFRMPNYDASLSWPWGRYGKNAVQTADGFTLFPDLRIAQQYQLAREEVREPWLLITLQASTTELTPDNAFLFTPHFVVPRGVDTGGPAVLSINKKTGEPYRDKRGNVETTLDYVYEDMLAEYFPENDLADYLTNVGDTALFVKLEKALRVAVANDGDDHAINQMEEEYGKVATLRWKRVLKAMDIFVLTDKRISPAQPSVPYPYILLHDQLPYPRESNNKDVPPFGPNDRIQTNGAVEFATATGRDPSLTISIPYVLYLRLYRHMNLLELTKTDGCIHGSITPPSKCFSVLTDILALTLVLSDIFLRETSGLEGLGVGHLILRQLERSVVRGGVHAGFLVHYVHIPSLVAMNQRPGYLELSRDLFAHYTKAGGVANVAGSAATPWTEWSTGESRTLLTRASEFYPAKLGEHGTSKEYDTAHFIWLTPAARAVAVIRTETHGKLGRVQEEKLFAYFRTIEAALTPTGALDWVGQAKHFPLALAEGVTVDLTLRYQHDRKAQSEVDAYATGRGARPSHVLCGNDDIGGDILAISLENVTVKGGGDTNKGMRHLLAYCTVMCVADTVNLWARTLYVGRDVWTSLVGHPAFHRQCVRTETLRNFDYYFDTPNEHGGMAHYKEFIQHVDGDEADAYSWRILPHTRTVALKQVPRVGYALYLDELTEEEKKAEEDENKNTAKNTKEKPRRRSRLSEDEEDDDEDEEWAEEQRRKERERAAALMRERNRFRR